jgi:hypothetical protein
MAGFQVGAACYETELQAAQVSASSVIGSIVQQGETAYVVNASNVAGNAISYTFSPVSGGAAFTVQSPYAAQPCGLLDISDGLAMGWLVVAAWASAYSVMFIRRALIGETGGSYGNT